MSDLISRQDAIKAIVNVDMQVYEGDAAVGRRLYLTQEEMIALIEALPSAEPERKKGKWIGDCCSCCGVSKYNYIKMVDDECGPFGTWNFCPNCGSEMTRGDR